MRTNTSRSQKTLFILAVAAAVLAGGRFLVGATDATASNWAMPSVMALQRVSAIPAAQHEPNFLRNLDCGLTTYRITGSPTMQTGCFTHTAFGLFDSDSETIIFNGTDEGLPLHGYDPHQILVPWPSAVNLLAFEATTTQGAYTAMYRDPLGVMKDEHNLLGQLTGKRMDAGPDLTVRDPSGGQLVVNIQTMAFSSGGSWLVAETTHGSFVRINLATLDMVAFAPSLAVAGSPGSDQSRVTISRDGRFAAIANDTANIFRVYDLQTCGSAVGTTLQARNCTSYDYRPFVKQQIPGLQRIQHVRFINAGLLSFEVTASDTTKSGIYEIAPTASIDSLIDYLGTGDSYTSGEGAFDYLAGSDTYENGCHLSSHSYPLLISRDLFSADGSKSVACSGAVIRDVGSENQNYRGQVKNGPSYTELQQNNPGLLASVMTNFLPGYVAQQRFISEYQPRIITVSVGGDDIGFGDIVQYCAEPHFSLHISDNTCFSTYEDRLELTRRIDKTLPRWTALFEQLTAQAPKATIYVIGYPQTILDIGTCALNVHLNRSELGFAAQVIDYLNQTIATAASTANVTYIDVSQALVGHRLCETASHNVAVNGLTSGTDGGIFHVNFLGKESYHPNALGHALIEQSILKQTHNFAVRNSAPLASHNTAILDVPKTGRNVVDSTPATILTDDLVRRGSVVQVRIEGLEYGIQPSTPYQVRLDGPNGPLLTTITSGPSAEINANITIPSTTPTGGHSIDIIGPTQTGPLDITQPVHVPGSTQDNDDDGISNTVDSCPDIINSGHDDDQDGVDDSCDPLITLAPTGNSGSATPSINTEQPTTTSSLQVYVPAAAIMPHLHITGVSSTTTAVNPSTANPQPSQSNNILGSGTIVSSYTKNTAMKAANRSNSGVKYHKRLPVLAWARWATLAALLWLIVVAIGFALRLMSRKGLSNAYMSNHSI